MPRTFNEKIQWRKINDRRSLLPLVVDKYGVREYVRERVGSDVLIPLLHVSSDPAKIPFDSLETPYIVKPNNGSGTKLVVRTRADIIVPTAVRQLRDVMREAHAWNWFEWAYTAVKPRIVVERLLLDPDGSLPRDYKFHVFDGRVAFLHVDEHREFRLQTVTYDREWRPAALQQVGIPTGVPAPPPDNAERMIKMAESLAVDLEYARIDLYNVRGHIYFGEITIYPDSGFRAFDPESWDRSWGDLWKLPDLRSGSGNGAAA